MNQPETKPDTLEDILAEEKEIIDRIVASGYAREYVESIALSLKVEFKTALEKAL